jgi:hypothetical protein
VDVPANPPQGVSSIITISNGAGGCTAVAGGGSLTARRTATIERAFWLTEGHVQSLSPFSLGHCVWVHQDVARGVGAHAGGLGVMSLGMAGAVIFGHLPPVHLQSVWAGVIVPELAAG